MLNLILLILQLNIYMLAHPFYASITDVNYNQKQGQLEIIARIFYDDLEAALKDEGSDKIDLIKRPNGAYIDSTLSNYLQKHLKVAVDGKIISTQFIGYQIDQDVASCYIMAETAFPLKSIEFKNDLLYHKFDKQSNIMHVKLGTLKRSTKLDNPNSLFKISL